jgi:deoxyribose-phosphate aldolase
MSENSEGGVTDRKAETDASAVDRTTAQDAPLTAMDAHRSAPIAGECVALTKTELASVIDHTFLKIDETTTAESLKRVVDETLAYGFRSLVVHPALIATIKRHHPEMRVTTVVSFPLGCDTTESKIFAIQDAALRGANDVDVVLDLFAIRAANFRKIAQEARRLVEVAHSSNLTIKLIIETPIVDDAFIRALTRALIPAGADFWKTSTGYGRKPTHLSHVRLLSQLAPEGVRIKASGGFRALADVTRALAEGASVVGTSASVAIMKEAGV